jgi:hypothetical protein
MSGENLEKIYMIETKIVRLSTGAGVREKGVKKEANFL